MKKIKTLCYYSKRSLRFLWNNSRQYVVLTLISIILDSVSAFPAIYLVSYSVDLITRHVEFSSYIRVISGIILLAVIIEVIKKILDTRKKYIKTEMYAKIQLKIDDICMNIDYENIQSKSFQENREFAIAALKEDCLDLFIHSLVQLASSILIMFGVLYIISEASFWIIIPLIVSLAIGFYYDYLNAKQNFTELKEKTEYRRKSTYLQSISRDFSYAKEIRLFNLKDRLKKRMDEVDELLFQLREARRKQRQPSGILYYSSEHILNIAIYIFFGYKVLVSQTMTLGLFTACHNALWQLKASVEDIIYVITDYGVHTQYLKGFFDFMDYKCPHPDERTEITKEIKAEIRFEHVFFRYPMAEEDTLQDINITIRAGEKLLIVGENGAGKSTFIKLLCALYKPTSGKIYLNGVDISTIERRQYIRQISAVFQDYQLFAFTIAENICALQKENKDAVDQALEQVNLETLVENTLHGTSSALYRIFDKDGVVFSGGEMQRLAIARAVYKDTPILVLDEPTSALDPVAEHEIYRSFRNIAPNRTTVVISHRLTSRNFSDRIAVFNKGKIVEYGTHDLLIKKQGLYAELYSIQAELYNEAKAKETVS